MAAVAWRSLRQECPVLLSSLVAQSFAKYPVTVVTTTLSQQVSDSLWTTGLLRTDHVSNLKFQREQVSILRLASYSGWQPGTTPVRPRIGPRPSLPGASASASGVTASARSVACSRRAKAAKVRGHCKPLHCVQLPEPTVSGDPACNLAQLEAGSHRQPLQCCLDCQTVSVSDCPGPTVCQSKQSWCRTFAGAYPSAL
jgi:hypothetical protein